ncbi:MAG: hypothetical protein OIF34_07515, partial [Porticoccaceae bacterium]|nr:hypothetical protein [Porticoccaceae bacterium]
MFNSGSSQRKKRWWRCLAALPVVVCHFSHADINDRLSLSVPEQPLSETLIELGRKSRVSIIFSHRMVRELRSA